MELPSFTRWLRTLLVAAVAVVAPCLSACTEPNPDAKSPRAGEREPGREPQTASDPIPQANAPREEGHRIAVRWAVDPASPGTAAVEVRGLTAAELESLRGRAKADPVAWQGALAVYAAPAGTGPEGWRARAGGADPGLPAMLGDYGVEAGVLRFRPQFPLEPGLEYRAVFHRDQFPGDDAGTGRPTPVIADFSVPARRMDPVAVVSRVYPTADELPENLLKFYIHFSAPMRRGGVYEHIKLREVSSGKFVELPFLEVDEELWDPTMTRFTLLIDPGRIKRGVAPLVDLGPVLVAGKEYELTIDADWRDAEGRPLKQPFARRFRAGPADREPPDPAKWQITPPAAGTREALAVRFTDPMDHALAERLIRPADASGHAVAGRVAMADAERQWKFVPDEPWRPGSYQIVVQPTVEDLAGNNVGKPFDVDVFEVPPDGAAPAAVRLPFEVRQARGN